MSLRFPVGLVQPKKFYMKSFTQAGEVSNIQKMHTAGQTINLYQIIDTEIEF